MPKRIPISAAKKLCQEQECRQVIVAAWDGDHVHIVTYGVSVDDCAQAAAGGNALKKALGFPKDTWNNWPSRVKKLEDRIKELEGQVASKPIRDCRCGNCDVCGYMSECDCGQPSCHYCG